MATTTLNYEALKTYGRSSISISRAGPGYVSLLLLGGIVCTGLLIIGETQQLVVADLGALALVLGLLRATARYVISQNKKRSALLTQFIKDNDFIRRKVDPNTLLGSMFAIGTPGPNQEAITGELNGFTFQLFPYSYTTGSGKSERTFIVAAMEVTLPHVYPQLVLDSLVEPGTGVESASTLPILYNPSQRIELEGDFSRYYEVYAPAGYGNEALVILTPNVMEALLKSGAGCDIEIIDNKLYFYWPGVSDTQQDFQDKFESVGMVLTAMRRQLLSKAAIVHSKDRVMVTLASGTYLRRTKWAHSTRQVVAWIFLAYFIIGLILPRVNFHMDATYGRYGSIVFIVLVVLTLTYPHFRKDSKAQRRRADWGNDHSEPGRDEWLHP